VVSASTRPLHGWVDGADGVFIGTVLASPLAGAADLSQWLVIRAGMDEESLQAAFYGGPIGLKGTTVDLRASDEDRG